MTYATSTKLSLFSLVAVLSSVQGCTTCLETLGQAQDCFRSCINLSPVPEWGGFSTFETQGASRLWQCMDDQMTHDFGGATKMDNLVQCCEMSSDCAATLSAAQTCAKNNCISPCVKNSANNYLGCIQSEARDGTCAFAGFACVGVLFGNNPDGTQAYDFQNMLSGAADQVSASDCTPLEPFIDGVCEVGDLCCSSCNTQMGRMVNCLVNEFIAPLSVSSGTSACSVTTPSGQPCSLAGPTSQSRGAGRDLNDSSTEQQEYVLEGMNVTECEEGLVTDFVVFNESYAVDQFLNCVGKKMGKIFAEEEPTQNNTDGASSACNTMLYNSLTIAGLAMSMLSIVIAGTAL